jgi:hypothetical protein
VLLTLGVTLSQLDGTRKGFGQKKTLHDAAGIPFYQLDAILAVLLTSFSSAFCNVLLEYLLKPSKNTTEVAKSPPPNSASMIEKHHVDYKEPEKPVETSMWIQIARLGVFALSSSTLFMFLSICKDGRLRSPFAHFSRQTCIVVILQSITGLLTAVVSRHTSAIMRAYSNSASIVLQALLSMDIFSTTDQTQQTHMSTMCGIVLVSVSLILYAAPSIDRDFIRIFTPSMKKIMNKTKNL